MPNLRAVNLESSIPKVSSGTHKCKKGPSITGLDDCHYISLQLIHEVWLQ